MLRNNKVRNNSCPIIRKRGPYNKNRHTEVRVCRFSGEWLPTKEDIIGHYLHERQENSTKTKCENEILNELVKIILTNLGNRYNLFARVTIKDTLKETIYGYKSLCKNMNNNVECIRGYVMESVRIIKVLGTREEIGNAVEIEESAVEIMEMDGFNHNREEEELSFEINNFEEAQFMETESNSNEEELSLEMDSFEEAEYIETETNSHKSRKTKREREIRDESENKDGGGSKKNYTNIENLCIIGLRYNVGINQIALLGSAALVDNNVITETNRSKVIDPKKVTRTIKKLTIEANIKFKEKLQIVNSIYFDSKKQETKQGKENLYVILHGKKNEFLTYGSAASDDARGTFSLIKDSLQKLDCNLKEIFLVGADGTNVNTGHKRGAIRLMEVSLSYNFLCKKN